MAGIDCEYWTKLDLWLLEDACLLASGEDPITYRLKPRPPQSGPVIFISSQHRDLRDFDPNSSPDWAKLYHLARAAIDAKTLPAVETKRGLAVRPEEFLPFAQGKGVTLPHWLADIASPRPAAGWPWGEHETELLRKLADAAREFWLPYDQSKHSKAPIKPPINKQVAGWLTEHGVSPRIAAAMATILRDDNQPRGRPKKRP